MIKFLKGLLIEVIFGYCQKIVIRIALFVLNTPSMSIENVTFYLPQKDFHLAECAMEIIQNENQKLYSVFVDKKFTFIFFDTQISYGHTYGYYTLSQNIISWGVDGFLAILVYTAYVTDISKRSFLVTGDKEINERAKKLTRDFLFQEGVHQDLIKSFL